MLDFLKLRIYNRSLIERLNSNSKLVWFKDIETLGHDKVFINTTVLKTYKGVLFCFYADYVEVLFKPHYYYNNDLHNANDFTVTECIDTLESVQSELGISFRDCLIYNIEFGVNIISPIPIKNLITWLKYHGRNPFINHKGLLYSKVSTSAKANGTYNTYKIIKAYAKGLQFPQYADANLFRFEVKSNRKAYINKLGIKTYADLLKRDSYHVLREIVLKEFESVLILDRVEPMDMSIKQYEAYKQYLDADLWYTFLNDYSRNVFSTHKKKFESLVRAGGQSTKSLLRDLINSKLEYLTKCADLTPLRESKKCAHLTVYKGQIRTPKPLSNTNCIVTGLSIDMQKVDSNLLSHTGLYHYREYDVEVFETLRQRFLTDYWKGQPLAIQIKEIAHNIRNYYYNRKIKHNRIYSNNLQTRLFNFV